MSKYDEGNDNSPDAIDELSLMEEQLLEEVVEQGPMPALAAVGSQKEVIQRYSHCGVCGGRLHFNYVTDFSRNTTHEKSSCPECALDTRQVLHRLQ